MPPLPEIARSLRLPPVVWRAPHAFVVEPCGTAAEFLLREAGPEGFDPAVIDYLGDYPAALLLWVALTRIDTPRLGPAPRLVALRLDVPAVPLATDHAGAYLIFFTDDFTGEASAMQPPRPHAFETQLPDPGPAPTPSLEPAVLPQPSAPEEDEEEREAGRGGGDDNPAFATHAYNIRPDIVDTPAGLATVTTMKSSQHEAFPDAESARAHLLAKLEGSVHAENQHEPQPEIAHEAAAPEPPRAAINPEVPEPAHDDGLRPPRAAEPAPEEQSSPAPAIAEDPEAAAFRQAEISVRRQEAETAARDGERYTEETVLSPMEHLAAKLEGSDHAEAKNEQQPEIAQDIGEGRDMGGRGMM